MFPRLWILWKNIFEHQKCEIPENHLESNFRKPPIRRAFKKVIYCSSNRIVGVQNWLKCVFPPFFSLLIWEISKKSSILFSSSPNQNWDRGCQIRLSTLNSWKWNGGIEMSCPSSQTQSPDCVVPWECRILQR